MYRNAVLTAFLASTVGLLACGDATEAPTSPTSSTLSAGSSGTLRVMLKDSPFSDAKSLLVTFSEVTAHQSGSGGFTRIPFAADATGRTCDLKKLTDAQDVLGTGPLAAGHYTQIRLVVSRAALYFDNAAEGPACAPTIAEPAGRSEVVEIPSGEVRLNREFTVPEAGATTMLLDFDGDRSVHATGNGRYRMNPVITVVSVQ